MSGLDPQNFAVVWDDPATAAALDPDRRPAPAAQPSGERQRTVGGRRPGGR